VDSRHTVSRGIGARIPDLEITTLPAEHENMDDYGETLEPIDPDELAGFYEIDSECESFSRYK
jgi:hypothetical protein